MYILGVSGKKGVGKNYITENYIVPKFIQKFSKKQQNIVPYFFSFGTPVKIELYSRDSSESLNYHNLFVDKTSETRKLLQSYATESGRDTYRKDMWIRAVDMWIQVHIENLKIVNKHLENKLVPLFVIEDVRFENEYFYIRKMGGLLVLIEAPQRNRFRILQESTETNTVIPHESEKGLEHLDFNLRLKNDVSTNSNLLELIDHFIEQLE